MAEKYSWENVKLSIPKKKPSTIEIFLDFAGSEIFLGEYQLLKEIGPLKEENVIVEITSGDITMVTQAYEVKPNDQLWQIAEKFHTDWETLARINNLAKPDLIRPGQMLRVPLENTNEGGFPLSQLDALTNSGNNQSPAETQEDTSKSDNLAPIWDFQLEGVPTTPGTIIFEGERFWRVGFYGTPYPIDEPRIGTIFWSRGRYWYIDENREHRYYMEAATEVTQPGSESTKDKTNDIGTTSADDSAWVDPLDFMKIRQDSIVHTFGPQPARYSGRHDGIDLYAPIGTRVKAVANGTITKVVEASSSKRDYGSYIILKFRHKDGNTYYAFYAHLSKVEVKENQKVQAGQVIGETGVSGNAYDLTGENEHLHFEVSTDPGVMSVIDPRPFFKAQMVAN